MKLRHFFGIIAITILLIGSGCNMDYRSKDDGGGGSSSDTSYTRLSRIQYIKSSDIDIRAELATDRDSDNVLTLSTEEQEYMYYRFTKRGSASDESDTDGSNAAVLANDSATLTLKDSLIFSDGSHAHGVFSLGDGTNITVSECVVVTMVDNSSGLMTYDEGTIGAIHATVETFGENSPALNVYGSGGEILADRGSYSTSGKNSPVILTNGRAGVSNARLEAKSSQAVIAEGEANVALQSCDVTANSEAASSDQAVMIYRAGTGNPLSETSYFTMSGGNLTSNNGDVFYASNVNATISLTGVTITNNDDDGAFLHAGASSWGTTGLNGGKITLYATRQSIEGDIELDGVSDMNMYLADNSYFTGAVNTSGTSARTFVSIANSRWTLTADSHISSLNCQAGSINLNGHTLYVNGTAYTAGTARNGTAIDFASDRSSPIETDENGDLGDDENDGDDDGDDTRMPVVSADTKTEASRLSFDATTYVVGTVNGVSYRAYNNIVYAATPADRNYQKLSIYIPEPYFNSRPLNGYTATTAPIFVPNNSSGYMAASVMTPSATNPVGLALSRGLIVVSPALRGRNINSGSAPSAIVDYKAAIRYIRANKSRLPAGNTDKIIASGVSSGGALSAILGASGNSDAYDEWLEGIGAADAEDKIFAAASYCPITNLENADGAYEWIFGGQKYGTESVALIENFASYVNSLGLTKDSVDLEIDGDSQTFRDYVEGLYVKAAQDALDSGTSITADWLNISGTTVISADLTKYAESFAVRQKSIPAFDKFDLSSPENSEFGYKHFTEYSTQHSTAGGTIADDDIIAAMNPMESIGNADTCKFWRIRHGVDDRDITIAIPAILALTLEGEGCNVDFEAVWGQGHGGYYDNDELFDWIDEICKE